jgi:hypothetical protein
MVMGEGERKKDIERKGEIPVRFCVDFSHFVLTTIVTSF